MPTQASAERLTITTEVIDMIELLERGKRFDLVVIANIHPETDKRAKLFMQASNSLETGGRLFRSFIQLNFLCKVEMSGLSSGSPPSSTD